jgi:hypothetical protein
MSTHPIRHELFKFMRQVSSDMAHEYDRIVKRAKEDPGTAGDAGEESWAELLRNWLPATYPIVTKGRILFDDDTASPQVDILVLSPNYPIHLRNKKMYFAGGVIAAFECKLTLKAQHLRRAKVVSKAIKEKLPFSTENPYESFNAPILYGLLAHSHSWTKAASVADQVFSIMAKIIDFDKSLDFDNLRYYPDVICVSDTASFCYRKAFVLSQDADESDEEILMELGAEHALSLSYDAYWSDAPGSWLDGTVHGTLIFFLTEKMAYRDVTIRSLATYLRNTDIAGTSIGRVNNYGIDIEDHILRGYFEAGGATNPWNPWGPEF